MPITELKTGLEVKGVQEILLKLESLAGPLHKSIVKAATSKALRPITRSAKAKLHPGHGVWTGTLKKAIGQKAVILRGKNVVWGAVGIRRGFKRQIAVAAGGPGYRYSVLRWFNPTMYMHLVERGTFRSTAKPFLRPALDENRGRSLAILSRETWAGLERAAARKAAKAALALETEQLEALR